MLPVTFTSDADRQGLVHRYSPTSSARTACGEALPADHGVVSLDTMKPLCPACSS